MRRTRFSSSLSLLPSSVVGRGSLSCIRVCVCVCVCVCVSELRLTPSHVTIHLTEGGGVDTVFTLMVNVILLVPKQLLHYLAESTRND